MMLVPFTSQVKSAIVVHHRSAQTVAVTQQHVNSRMGPPVQLVINLTIVSKFSSRYSVSIISTHVLLSNVMICHLDKINVEVYMVWHGIASVTSRSAGLNWTG